MEEKPFRRALHASREDLRMVAMDMKERADAGTSYENAMRLYAKATFWATLALSAPETDAEPSPEEDTPVPVADAPTQAQEDVNAYTYAYTYAYAGHIYDLSESYRDRDGDVWRYTGKLTDSGIPIMRGDGMADTALTSVVNTWGPLTLVGSTCSACGREG